MKAWHLLLVALLQAQDLSQLSWMSGTWASTTGTTQQEEHWTSVKGAMLLGLNRTISGTRMSFEFLRIEQTEKGIAYIAQPEGRPPVAFPMVEMSANRVVFENRAHDFPQRILYWREGDILNASVEGPRNGTTAKIKYTWKRVN